MDANELFPIRNSMGEIIPVVLVTGLNYTGKTTFLWELSRHLDVPRFDHFSRSNVFQNYNILVMTDDPKNRILLCDEIDWGLDTQQQRDLWRDLTKFADLLELHSL